MVPRTVSYTHAAVVRTSSLVQGAHFRSPRSGCPTLNVGSAKLGCVAATAQVPTTAPEAMQSSLMSVMEKTRAVQFFAWVNNYDARNAATHTAGIFRKRTFDLARTTAADFFKCVVGSAGVRR
jgi:hypothetical protein